MCHTHTPGGSQSLSGFRNVTTATAVTTGTEHFHPAYYGTCVLGHSGVRGDENADKLVSLLDLNRSWGCLGRIQENRYNGEWTTIWRGLICTQKQTRKQISSPSPTATTRLLSFNRTQPRAVIGLLSEHNTMEDIFT